jgi:hypothetical protein
LILNKVAKIYIGERKVSPINGVEEKKTTSKTLM